MYDLQSLELGPGRRDMKKRTNHSGKTTEIYNS